MSKALAALIAIVSAMFVIAEPSAGKQSADAAALLAQAAIVTSQQPSFEIVVKNEEGDTKIVRGVNFHEVEGDIQMPDRLDADVRAKAVVKTLTIEVRLVGSEIWWTDPVIGRFSGFEQRDVDPALIALLAPQSVILLIPQLVEQPVLDGPQEIDERLLTRVSGTVDFDRVVLLTGVSVGALAEGQGSLPVQIWIDDQGRIVRLRIEGKALDRDGDDVIRIITFSDFGKEVDIQRPD
jgi:hypothetical protein